MADLDTKLKSLFAVPPTSPDELFVTRINCAIVAEEKMRGAQVAMWRRFAAEIAGTVAVVAAFYLLWKMAPSGIEIKPLTRAPTIAAIMILLMWLLVQLKQFATAR